MAGLTVVATAPNAQMELTFAGWEAEAGGGGGGLREEASGRYSGKVRVKFTEKTPTRPSKTQGMRAL